MCVDISKAINDASESPQLAVGEWLDYCGHIKTKSVETVSAAHSTYRGRRICPLLSKRATQDSHADMNEHLPNSLTRRGNHTTNTSPSKGGEQWTVSWGMVTSYPWASIVAMFPDSNKSFLRFRYVRNKAHDKRLFHIWYPHCNPWPLLQILFPMWLASHHRREGCCKFTYLISSMQIFHWLFSWKKIKCNTFLLNVSPRWRYNNYTDYAE